MKSDDLSSIVKNNIKNKLKKDELENGENEGKYDGLVNKKQLMEFDYLKMFDTACRKLNSKLTARKNIESFLSGATGCMVMIHRGLIISANIGDSRAVLYQFKSKTSKNLAPIRITRDHTPNIATEKQRILNSGGKVYKMKSKHFSKF